MKRILLSLIAASGFALMAASPAGAVNALCGKSYAMLLQGAAPNSINQDGSSTQPGALTAAAGAGVITFGAASGTSCASVAGSMILNVGDIQTNPAGFYFGPAHCYDADSLLTTGLPCFDGTDHFAGSTLVAPGVNGNGSQDLVIHAGYTWLSGAQTTGTAILSFTLQNNTGGAVVVGTAKPGTGSPVLTLTMQKIGNPGAVATTYGAAPYLGNLAVSCSSYGANATDFVSASLGNGLSGGFGSLVGMVEIFSDGEAGGSISFDSNDNLTASGFTGTQPSNNDCSIAVFPGTADPGYNSGGVTASQFADGTSNSVASIDNSTGSCTDDLTAGAGYANSAAAWGPTDTASYLTTTGVVTTATGFLPPGTIGTCTTYASAPAGKLTSGATATQALINAVAATPVLKVVKLTNTSPADCHVVASLTGTLTDGNCTLSISNGNTDIPGDTTFTTTAQGAPTLSCVCGPTEDDPGLSATLNISAPGTYPNGSCPVALGGGPVTVTCTN